MYINLHVRIEVGKISLIGFRLEPFRPLFEGSLSRYVSIFLTQPGWGPGPLSSCCLFEEAAVMNEVFLSLFILSY